MKSGYDQFFKNARQAQATPVGKKTVLKNNSQKIKKNDVQKQIEQQLNSAVTEEQVQKHLQSKIKLKKRRKTFHPMMVISFVGFLTCLFGFVYHEDVEKFVQKIEVSFIGEVQANDIPPATTPVEPVAAAAAPVDAKVEIADDEHFLKLQARKVELDQREEELKRKEAALQDKEVILQTRLKELDEMRGKISAILEERTKTDEKKIETLVQVYTNMKPPQAAKVFETLDEDLAVELLGRMKKKSAADIMNLLKPEKAQLFSERIAGYRLPASK